MKKSISNKKKGGKNADMAACVSNPTAREADSSGFKCWLWYCPAVFLKQGT